MTQKRKGGARLAPGKKGRAAGTAPRPDSDETLIWRKGDPIKVTPAHFWDGEEKPKEKEKPKKPRRHRWPVVLGVVAVVLLVLFVRYRQWAKPPDLPGVDRVDTPVADPDTSDVQDGEQPETGPGRKDGFYTFLLIGRDTGGGGNTDTLMLAAYDVKNQQAALMSIPRDTMVDVSWDVKKINSVYNMYLGQGQEAAVDALKEAVAGLVGFQPDFTVTVEWEAVGDIVNAIGGVWFEVPFYMHYGDPTQNLLIDQPAGYRLLNGDDAMQVVRWRKNNMGDPLPAGADGSDLGRAKIQQAFIMATLKQCLQLKNVTRINEIAQVFTQRVETELTAGNLMWFAEQAVFGGFSAEELYTCTLPSAGANVYSSSYKTNLSYVIPQSEALLTEVNTHFNPFEDEVTMENLDLMQLDRNGGAYATGGTPLG